MSNTGKIVSMIIYTIIVGVVAYFVAMYARADKIVSYLEDNKNDMLNDELALISKTVAANSDGSLDAFVLREPLFQVQVDNAGYSFSCYIYSFVQFNDSEENDNLAIILKDIKISDEKATLEDDKYNVVSVNIVFDRTTEFGASLTEEMSLVFDNTTRLYLINLDNIKVKNEIAKIKGINFSYKTSVAPITALILNDYTFIEESGGLNPSFDIQNINGEKRVLSDLYDPSKIKNDGEIFYDGNLIKAYNKYNIVYVKDIGILLLIVAVLTYFIFFHKTVLIKARIKKRNKELHDEFDLQSKEKNDLY